MAELLIVLMMAFNLWMVIYLTWERREESVPREDKEKDAGAPERSGDIMGKSLFRMPERKPQAAASVPDATRQVPGEEVDEKDVAFDDETASPNSRLSGARPSHQVPDEELDEVFADRRVSDIGVEYDEDGNYDGTHHEASGFTFEDIDLAMRTVKKPAATMEERRHAGMVFCDMKGNELFAMIEKSSEATRRKLNELMDFYMDSVSATIRKEPTPTAVRITVPNVPDNIEDFNIRDFV